jgi:hypothetical protein
MVGRDALEDLLWDLVYDLLPDEEAAAVRDRIASNADVARLYAEVKRQAAILAEAAKWEHPVIRLPRLELGSEDTGTAGDAQPQLAAPRGTSEHGIRRPSRLASWSIALAASLLLCFLGYAYLRPKSPLRPAAVATAQQSIPREVVRTTLIGPRELHPNAANVFTVLTRTAAGEPRAAEVAYRFSDVNGAVLGQGECVTSSSGLGQIAVGKATGARPVRLVVEPKASVSVPAATKTIPAGAAGLATYLTTDKPVYQSGETVRYRSVTLSRFDLQVAHEVPVVFHLLGPQGERVPGSEASGVTVDGVGSGEFALPVQQAPGRYALVASSPDGEFTDVHRQVAVANRRFVELAKAKKLGVERVAGKASAVGSLADLAVTKEKGGEAFNDVLIDFYPESGELVAGVPNRVYFFAHDPQGVPIDAAGQMADRSGRAVAEVKTHHAGRGVFTITPTRGDDYRLEIARPAGASVRSPRLAAGDGRFLALHAGPGVFPAGGRLALELRSTDCSRPVVVSAFCRGVLAGQTIVAREDWDQSADGAGSSKVSLTLPEEADGSCGRTLGVPQAATGSANPRGRT